MNMHLLLTGGTGYLGSAMLSQLQHGNYFHEITATFHRSNPKTIRGLSLYPMPRSSMEALTSMALISFATLEYQESIRMILK